MAVGQPFPRGTFKVGIGPGEREVSVIFKPTQSTIVFSLSAPVNSLRNIRSITQDLATSVALMKWKLWRSRPCLGSHERKPTRRGRW
jgi:hypothetical protein